MSKSGCERAGLGDVVGRVCAQLKCGRWRPTDPGSSDLHGVRFRARRGWPGRAPVRAESSRLWSLYRFGRLGWIKVRPNGLCGFASRGGEAERGGFASRGGAGGWRGHPGPAAGRARVGSGDHRPRRPRRRATDRPRARGRRLFERAPEPPPLRASPREQRPRHAPTCPVCFTHLRGRHARRACRPRAAFASVDVCSTSPTGRQGAACESRGSTITPSTQQPT